MISGYSPQKFKVYDEAVDPAAVPFRTISSGRKIPAIGLGTFGSDHNSPQDIADAVIYAAGVGYRHFDCAAVYANEDYIGVALQEIMSGGVRREELFVTSKLWNDMHAESDVVDACKRSLQDLRLDYLDLYLVHWPFPNYHAPGCDVSSRSPDARPYVHEEFMKTWRQMEKLVDMGLVRHIGTSNMTIAKMKLLLHDAKYKPAVNEMELHPHFQQLDFYNYIASNGIVPVGYCPIGSPNRPERDRTSQDTVDIEDPVITEIARVHNVHPVSVCLKWAVQRGQIPIPMSVKPKNILSNIKAVVADPLSEKELKAIARIDKDCRLIKGQVFLWREDQDWQDLWDVDGVIKK